MAFGKSILRPHTITNASIYSLCLTSKWDSVVFFDTVMCQMELGGLLVGKKELWTW